VSVEKMVHSDCAFLAPKRMVRSLLTAVTLISTTWGMGEAADWVQLVRPDEFVTK